MKYIKKYNENKTDNVENIRNDVGDIFIDLCQDLDLHITVHKRELDSKNIFYRVDIFSENRFEYEQISEEVERLKDYMAMNDFYCQDFSSYFGPGREKKPKIQLELNRQFNRFGDGRWTEKAFFFQISFKSLSMSDIKANEELKPEVYKSAADKLTKMGHIKRPEELMKWHDIIKKREEDAKKKVAIEDAKQLGVYQCKLRFSKLVRAGIRESKEFTGNFYLRLVYDKWQMEDMYNDFKNDGGNLWMSFSYGIIPSDAEGEEYCQEVIKPIVGLGSDGVTYWLGCLWVNLTENNEPGDLTFKPAGKAYFECYEGDFYLTNRASAMQFKKKLFELFNGDIVLNETPDCPGGEKERIIDDLCSDRRHEIDEYIDIMNSIKKVNINSLYKD